MVEGPAPLSGIPATSMVYQYLAHGPRGDTEEMRSIVQWLRGRSGEFEPGLVNQLGRTQRVVLALPAKRPLRRTSQLIVDQGEQLIGRLLVSGAEALKQAGDLSCRIGILAHVAGLLLTV
jgi:hypothetical protein